MTLPGLDPPAWMAALHVGAPPLEAAATLQPREDEEEVPCEGLFVWPTSKSVLLEAAREGVTALTQEATLSPILDPALALKQYWEPPNAHRGEKGGSVTWPLLAPEVVAILRQRLQEPLKAEDAHGSALSP